MLVTVIGIPGLLAAKDFFLCYFKRKLSIYEMTSHNIYHFPFPTYSQKTLDVVAVSGVAGQF